MRFNILVVGDDRALNLKRLQLLQGYHKVTVTGVNQFIRHLKLETCDLLILCHSIPIQTAVLIIELAAESRSVWKTLWLAEWQTVDEPDGSLDIVTLIDRRRKQPWLAEVQAILQSIHADWERASRSRCLKSQGEGREAHGSSRPTRAIDCLPLESRLSAGDIKNVTTLDGSPRNLSQRRVAK